MAPPQRRARPPRRGRSVHERALIPAPPVNGFNLVTLVGIVSGQTFRTTLPTIQFRASSTLGGPVDVQIEWRTTMPVVSPSGTTTPDATYTQVLTGLGSGTLQSVQPPTPLSLRSWWYRFRAGSSTSGTWGAWTDPSRYLNVQASVGSVTSYVELNVGVLNASPVRGATAYTDMNVGSNFDSANSVVSYSDLNVGLLPGWKLTSLYADFNISPRFGTPQFATYADLNVDSTLRPDPVIWWIRPEQGREGYAFNIYGHGFGDYENEYDGTVRLGDLICSVARWERVPAVPRPSTVTVSGTPRTSSSTTNLPYVLLDSSSYVVQAGDVIEFDMRWDLPGASRLDIFPYFTVSGIVMGYGSALLNDTDGNAWVSDQPGAYGTWKHRKFVVPSGHFLVGKTLSNFGVAWYGFQSSAPVRTGAVRSFVIRNSDGVVQKWITGDDQTATSKPVMTYVANTGVLTSSDYAQEGHVISHGQALDPDVITPEHGWIVAIVPTGAVSSMVSVTLEGS